MANATRDPLFLAALTVAEQDAPGAGAYCLRCHTPKGLRQGTRHRGRRRAGRGRQPGGRLRGVPPLDRRVDGAAGRRCTTAPRSPRSPPWTRRRPTSATRGCSGIRATSATVPTTTRTAPRTRRPGTAWTRSSELCGQCHEVLSPLRNLLDAAAHGHRVSVSARQHLHRVGVVRLRAARARLKSCVDCHMPAARGDALTVSTFPSSLPRANPRMHLFVGGNDWGLEAVKLAAPEIATERAAAFDAAAAAVRAMLASAVRIDVTPGPASAGRDHVRRRGARDQPVRPQVPDRLRRRPARLSAGGAARRAGGIAGRARPLRRRHGSPRRRDGAAGLGVDPGRAPGRRRPPRMAHRQERHGRQGHAHPARRIPTDRRGGDRDDRAGRRRLRPGHRDAELRRRRGALLVAGAAAARDRCA